MKNYILFLFAFLLVQCREKPAQFPAGTITPGEGQATKKYKVKFEGEMTIEEIGAILPPPPDTVVIPPVDPPIIPPVPGTGTFFLGCNTNHYQDKTKQVGFSGTRLYLPIGWAYTAKGFYGQPLLQAQKQFDGVDDYLAYMKLQGRDVLLTLMESPDWLNGHTKGWITNDFPPIKPGLDKKDPASWKDVAEIYRAFAIRYGSTVHPKGSYKIDPAGPRWNGDPPQEEKSGMKLVRFIEVGNEFDCWWSPEKYLQPEEQAALLLTSYDAIKSADPNMGVIMAGLTNHDVPYLERMNAFFKSKGRVFLSDAINTHRYNNAGNKPGVHPPTWHTNQAVSVEQDPGISDFARVMAFAKSAGRPAWVTEYGYDSRPGSQMSPTPQNGKTLEQLQAEWLPRAALEYQRMGAERTYLFTMADEPNPDGGLFTSCGVLYGESRGYAPKPAYQAVTALTASLRGLTFAKDESTAQARIMRFEGNGKTVWSWWSPTAENKTFQAAVGGKTRTVTEAVQIE